MRVCKMCEIEKDITEYYLKKNGKVRSSYCKVCYNIVYKTEYDKEYYENNKEKFKQNYKSWCLNNDRSDYMKSYRENNKDELSRKQKKFRENNKELVRKRKKDYWDNLSIDRKVEISNRKREIYHLNNYKIAKRNYFNKKFNNDSLFKLTCNIRCLIKNAFNRKFTTKSKKTIEILGCSFDDFKSYLESKFDENMNWENQGTYWHLDHIIPISSAQSEDEVYKLNHYTNFQPLYWLDNLKKSNKY